MDLLNLPSVLCDLKCLRGHVIVVLGKRYKRCGLIVMLTYLVRLELRIDPLIFFCINLPAHLQLSDICEGIKKNVSY